MCSRVFSPLSHIEKIDREECVWAIHVTGKIEKGLWPIHVNAEAVNAEAVSNGLSGLSKCINCLM